MSEGEINDEESPEHQTNVTSESNVVSNALTSKSNEIDDLVQEVTENETTAAGLPDKMAAVL